MNCQQVREFLDGFLLVDNCMMLPEEITAHIAKCPDCEREFERAQTAIASIQVSHSIHASEKLKQRVLSQVAALPTNVYYPPQVTRRSWRSSPRFMQLAAAAVIVLAALLVLMPFGNSVAQAYAVVAQQLRDALVVSFETDWSPQPGGPPTKMRIAYHKPALQRLEMKYGNAFIIQVYDTDKRRGLVLVPETSTVLTLDFDSMQSAEKQRLAVLDMFTTTVRELPAKADSHETRKDAENRELTGFHVGNTIYWIDTANKSLVEIERKIGNKSTVLRNFQFDPPDLGEREFSIEPPAGYKAMSAESTHIRNLKPDEKALAEYLRLSSSMIAGGQFPASLNPLEMISLQKDGKLKKDSPMSEAERQELIKDFSQASQSVVQFVMSMQPQNDFHYEGKDAVLGQAGNPIAWWKPTGAAKYRILRADLTFTEGEVPAKLDKTAHRDAATTATREDDTVVSSVVNTLTRATEVMQRVSMMHIEAKMRTLPRDNFDLVWLEADLLPVHIWKTMAPTLKWRVEKEGRVVVMDGQATTMLMGYGAPAPAGLKVDSRAFGFIGWLQPLLTLDKLLPRELDRVQNQKADVRLSKIKTPGGEPVLRVVIAARAQGNFTESDYGRNKSVLESDNVRTYEFGARDYQLKAMQIDMQTSSGTVRVFETTSIEYDATPDASVFVLEIPNDTIWQKLPGEEKQTSDTSLMKADDVARAYFQACADSNWATAAVFDPGINRPDTQNLLGGLTIISIGTPFHSGLYPGWFVPYEIKFKSGRVQKHNLAVRNDNPKHQWYVDGGI